MRKNFWLKLLLAETFNTNHIYTAFTYFIWWCVKVSKCNVNSSEPMRMAKSTYNIKLSSTLQLYYLKLIDNSNKKIYINSNI